MKFILLVLVPFVISWGVLSITNSWIWGIVSFPIGLLIVNWIAVWLFGHPDDKELRRITNRPVGEDFSKEELSLESRQIASKFGFKPEGIKVPDEILKMARYIGSLKNNLPLEWRDYLNTYGIYIQSGRNAEPTLPMQGFLYMVGGRLIPKLIFLDEDCGDTKIIQYEEGDWLKCLNLTYQKAIAVWTAFQSKNQTSIIEALSIDENNKYLYSNIDSFG